MSEAKRLDFATSKFWPILWFQAFFGTIAEANTATDTTIKEKKVNFER